MTTCVNLQRAQIMDWRNVERAAVIRTLKNNLDIFLPSLVAQVDEMTKWELASAWAFHKSRIDPLVADWIAEQDALFRARIEASARLDTEEHPELDPGALEWSEILRFGAGAALGIAPLAAIPFVASIATVSTGVFFVTVSFNPVVLGVAAVGAAGVALLGGRVRDAAVDMARTRLKAQIAHKVQARVLGVPEKPNAASLATTLLAEVDTVGQLRMRALT